jgi:mono/diheme cytochrome c family protein
VLLGSRIFVGAAAGGTCSGCHGSDGKGSTVGPDLTGGNWQWGNGSLAAIAATIDKGSSNPSTPMAQCRHVVGHANGHRR